MFDLSKDEQSKLRPTINTTVPTAPDTETDDGSEERLSQQLNSHFEAVSLDGSGGSKGKEVLSKPTATACDVTTLASRGPSTTQAGRVISNTISSCGQTPTTMATMATVELTSSTMPRKNWPSRNNTRRGCETSCGAMRKSLTNGAHDFAGISGSFLATSTSSNRHRRPTDMVLGGQEDLEDSARYVFDGGGQQIGDGIQRHGGESVQGGASCTTVNSLSQQSPPSCDGRTPKTLLGPEHETGLSSPSHKATLAARDKLALHGGPDQKVDWPTLPAPSPSIGVARQGPTSAPRGCQREDSSYVTEDSMYQLVDQEDVNPSPPVATRAGATLRPGGSRALLHQCVRHKFKCRSYRLTAVAVCYLAAVLVMVASKHLTRPSPGGTGDQHDTAPHGVRLKRDGEVATIMEGNGTDNGTDECPSHEASASQIYIMSYEVFMRGGWIVHVIIGLYTFAAIAAICDIYFVPSLEHICEDLKLDADVAGATFMAAASSAPEFCTSVIGIFVQKNDVGLGAIVGSSIFNLLAIVGLCAIFSGMNVELSWYPLTRDSIFYTVAVFEMLAFMYDNTVHWYESFVMIITYMLYILVMVYNKKIEGLVNTPDEAHLSRANSFTSELHRTGSNQRRHSARLEIIRARSHSRSSSHGLRLSNSKLKQIQTQSAPAPPSEPERNSNESTVQHAQGSIAKSSTVSQLSEQPVEGSSTDPKKVATVVVQSVEEIITPPETSEAVSEPAVAEYENPLEFPETCAERTYWVAVLPITILHAFTIPDSRIQDSWQSKYYMIPFALSVLYLAIYSYIMVWAMSVAAWGLGIPATVTGLTVLAAGTSVPDCLSSIFVARAGLGDMAVSNAIGSNVFDILLCLGVPWLVTGIKGGYHTLDSEGMWVAGSTLVVTIFYLIISLHFSNWTLTPFYGFFTLVIYIFIITFCILVEMNIIFNLHPNQKCQYGIASHR